MGAHPSDSRLRQAYIRTAAMGLRGILIVLLLPVVLAASLATGNRELLGRLSIIR